MGIFSDSEKSRNYVFPPKVGEKLEVTITGELKRVTTDPTNEGNYKSRTKNFGYFDVIGVDGDKEMKINTWKLYFALKEVDPEIGDIIVINHVSSGEYTITKK